MVDAHADCNEVIGSRLRRAILRNRRTRLAFTLIELIAAMTIAATLVAIAIPRGHDMIERAKVVRAIGDIHVIMLEIEAQDTLPDDLAAIGRDGLQDPWGRPYVYYKFPVSAHGHGPPSGARRDRFLVPVNSTYDLYSVGADGRTVSAFTAQASRDDVVRASDGDYIGLASKY